MSFLKKRNLAVAYQRFSSYQSAKIRVASTTIRLCTQMNSVIVLFSYHHKNTEKIAQVIAKVIGAEIKTPEQTDPNTLTSLELVGFGSGVYFGKLGKPILELADKIPQVTGKKAFIFSTSGRAGKAAAKFHKTLKEKLESKGYIGHRRT